ncbi:MAG TPA: DUF4180 domain-containing protein [Vicinamibacterales bacterium]|nr:DUF4180 domain-containing protein [Vicinamibacterales bacterium]
MDFSAVDYNGLTIVEADPDAPLMRRPDDAARLVEACFSARTRCALVYAANVTPRFFDLSSGEAGLILDKLRRFRVRLAVVCRPGSVTFSSRFAELRADDLRTFETREAACAWLAATEAR